MKSPKSFKTIDAFIETLPLGDEFQHEITWWINRRLTMDEWIKLDKEMGEAFIRSGVDPEDVMGVAGPVPDLGEE